MLLERTIKNISYNLVGWSIPVFLGIVAIPYFVLKLTISGYGIWVILSSLTGYFPILELGLSKALVKYIPHFKVKNDFLSIKHSVNSVMCANILIGGLGGLFIFSFSDPIVKGLKVSHILFYDSSIALKVASIGMPLTLIFNTLYSVLRGLQRFDILNKFDILKKVILILSLLLVLSLGYGLVEMVYTILLIQMISVGLLLSILYRIIPYYQIEFRIEFHYLIKQFNFGIYTVVSQMASFVNNRLPELLIGFLWGAEFITFFSIPKLLIEKFSGCISHISSVFFPLSSELISENDEKRIKRTYLFASKYLSILMAPFYFLFIFFSSNILNLWMGSTFAEKSWIILTILGITYIISNWTIIPTNYLYGLGRSGFVAIFSIILLLISSLLLFILTYKLNIIGTAIGVLTSQLAGVYFIYYSNKKILFVENKIFIMNVFVIPSAIALSLGFFLFLFFPIFVSVINQKLLFIIMSAIYIFSFFTCVYFIPGIIDDKTKVAILRSAKLG
jgi:O-antigen/teichoic acid export membrane protein